MTPKRFRKILNAYGADPARWPADEAAAIRDLLARSQEARRMAAQAGSVDRFLDQWETPTTGLNPADIAARVSALPQTPDHNGIETTGWRITLGWPNFAGLAAAAAAGFLVGFLGVADLWVFGTGVGVDVIPELLLSEDALW